MLQVIRKKLSSAIVGQDTRTSRQCQCRHTTKAVQIWNKSSDMIPTTLALGLLYGIILSSFVSYSSSVQIEGKYIYRTVLLY